MPYGTFSRARDHLFRRVQSPDSQEELCLAFWRPSTGRSRCTAIISELALPSDNDRDSHGKASLDSDYLARSMRAARERGMGLALLSRLASGWQEMSEEDAFAERQRAAPLAEDTRLPLVGLTMGTDGGVSARFWLKGTKAPTWCAKVRVAGGDTMRIAYNERLVPSYSRDERLKRTIDSWGLEMQERMARLKLGVVGLGSVGAIVAESLARMGFSDLVLIDPDKVEMHNLDRLLHAGFQDVGVSKVRLAEKHAQASATARNFKVTGLCAGLQTAAAYEVALDCDLLFACVDRPLPKDILNNIAYAHCIPVFFGGVYIATKTGGRLAQASWTVARIAPDTRCLRCDGQYSTSDVTQERDGTLDDPRYVSHRDEGATPHSNQNVFSFSASLASRLVNEMVRFLIAEEWWPQNGPKVTFNLVTNTQLQSSEKACHPGCEVRARTGAGDSYRYPFLDPAKADQGTQCGKRRAS